MQRYGGALIHRSRDSDGVLEVVDQNGLRSLHFGTPDFQSRMQLLDANVLVLDYTRAMMAPMLFTDQPNSALLLGLGGGSLAKFLFHHFPHCRLDVVENRESVVRLAYTYFQLPCHERLRVYVDDARDFLNRSTEQCYDWILMDLFDAQGPTAAMADACLFGACRKRLEPGGVLGVNLWRSDEHDPTEIIALLSALFDDRVLELPVAGKYNTILLGLCRFSLKPAMGALRQRARVLAARFAIDYPRLLKELRRYNRHAL